MHPTTIGTSFRCVSLVHHPYLAGHLFTLLEKALAEAVWGPRVHVTGTLWPNISGRSPSESLSFQLTNHDHFVILAQPVRCLAVHIVPEILNLPPQFQLLFVKSAPPGVIAPRCGLQRLQAVDVPQRDSYLFPESRLGPECHDVPVGRDGCQHRAVSWVTSIVTNCTCKLHLYETALVTNCTCTKLHL